MHDPFRPRNGSSLWGGHSPYLSRARCWRGIWNFRISSSGDLEEGGKISRIKAEWKLLLLISTEVNKSGLMCLGRCKWSMISFGTILGFLWARFRRTLERTFEIAPQKCRKACQSPVRPGYRWQCFVLSDNLFSFACSNRFSCFDFNIFCWCAMSSIFVSSSTCSRWTLTSVAAPYSSDPIWFSALSSFGLFAAYSNL